MNKEIQEELIAYLQLVDDEPKPLAGTNINNRGEYQYTRLAIVRLPPGSYMFDNVASDRHFVVFAESNWLYDVLHEKIGTPEWIKEGFDSKWIYIEEILHKPRPGEILNEYTTILPQNENDLWLALFTFVVGQGILEKSARKLVAKTYKLPTK